MITQPMEQIPGATVPNPAPFSASAGLVTPVGEFASLVSPTVDAAAAAHAQRMNTTSRGVNQDNSGITKVLGLMQEAARGGVLDAARVKQMIEKMTGADAVAVTDSAVHALERPADSPSPSATTTSVGRRRTETLAHPPSDDQTLRIVSSADAHAESFADFEAESIWQVQAGVPDGSRVAGATSIRLAQTVGDGEQEELRAGRVIHLGQGQTQPESAGIPGTTRTRVPQRDAQDVSHGDRAELREEQVTGLDTPTQVVSAESLSRILQSLDRAGFGIDPMLSAPPGVGATTLVGLLETRAVSSTSEHFSERRSLALHTKSEQSSLENPDPTDQDPREREERDERDLQLVRGSQPRTRGQETFNYDRVRPGYYTVIRPQTAQVS